MASFNKDALLQNKFDALIAAISKQTDLLTDIYAKEARVSRRPNLRSKQEEEMAAAKPQGGLFDEQQPPPRIRTRRGQLRNPKPGESPLFANDVATQGADDFWLPPQADDRLAPDSNERQQEARRPKRKFGHTMRDLRDAYDQQVGPNGSKTKSLLGAMGSFASGNVNDPFQQPASQDANASMPPNANSTGGGTGGLASMLANPTSPNNNLSLDDQQAVTWALLGEHGGPKFVRNMALEAYGLKRSIKWAQGAAQQVSDYATSPENANSRLSQALGVNPNAYVLGEDGQPILDENGNPQVQTPASMQALQGAFNIAASHPYMTYGVWKGGQVVGQGIKDIGANLRNYQGLGQQYGYGPSALGGQAMFGIHNPLGDFSTAARVGGAFNLEAQALQGRMPGAGFGNGLTGEQAQAVMETLGSQGFSMKPESSIGGGALNVIGSIPGIGGPLASLLGGLTGGQPEGNAAMIGQNFMRPLMQRFPGLKAQDLGEFTGSLRYSGTSIQQLTDSLNSLGVESRAANLTVGQMASSVAQAGQSFAQMGSSPQGGQDVASGFTATTGLPPQTAAQFAQNPLFQAMGVSRGVMPAALGQLNPGAFGGMAMNEINLLRNVTKGFNRPLYNKFGGLEMSGQQQQIAMIAQWTGLPYNHVKQMMGDMPHENARNYFQGFLGSANQGTGFWGAAMAAGRNKLDPQQYAAAQKQWHNLTGDPQFQAELRASGISRKDFNQISRIPGMRDRATKLQGAISNATKDDPWNQIQNTPKTGTMSIGLTPQAQKWFQLQGGPSTNTKMANAGGPAKNIFTNSYTGDLTNQSPTAQDIQSTARGL